MNLINVSNALLRFTDSIQFILCFFFFNLFSVDKPRVQILGSLFLFFSFFPFLFYYVFILFRYENIHVLHRNQHLRSHYREATYPCKIMPKVLFVRKFVHFINFVEVFRAEERSLST